MSMMSDMTVVVQRAMMMVAMMPTVDIVVMRVRRESNAEMKSTSRKVGGSNMNRVAVVA
jgi:hypothetical protein